MAEEGARKEVFLLAQGEGGEEGEGAALEPLQPEVRVARGNAARSSRAEAEEPLRALKWCTSGVLCAAFLGLGMAIANLGPTFPDLASNVNRNVSQISFIFVGRSSGYFGGTLIGGLLVDCMNAKILLGFSMLATATGLYAIPWCKTATLLTAMMSVIGFSMGVLDTGGNVTALDTWGWRLIRIYKPYISVLPLVLLWPQSLTKWYWVALLWIRRIIWAVQMTINLL